MKVGIRLLQGAGGLLLLAVAALTSVFFWPALLFNTTTLRLTAAYLRLEGVQLDWQEMTVHATSSELWRKDFAMQAHNFCLRVPAVGLSSCAPELQLATQVWAQPGAFHVVSIGPSRLVAKDFRLGPELASRPPDKSARPFDLAELQLPRWLQGTDLRPVHIEVQEVQLSGLIGAEQGTEQGPEASVRGALSFDASAAAGEYSASVRIKNVCLPEGLLALSGCVQRADAEARARFGDGGVGLVLTQVGPVTAEAGTLKVQTAAASSAPASVASAPTASLVPTTAGQIPLPALLATARWEPLRLSVGKLSFASPEAEASGRLNLSLTPRADGADLDLLLASGCARLPQEGVRVCLSRFNFRSALARDGANLRLQRLGPLTLLEGRAIIVAPPEAAPAKAAPAGASDRTLEDLLAWLDGSEWGAVQIGLSRVTYQHGPQAVALALALNGQPQHGQGRGNRWSLTAKTLAVSGLPLDHGEASFQAESLGSPVFGPWRLNGKASATLIGGAKAQLAAASSPDASGLALTARGSFQQGKGEATVTLNGRKQAQTLQLNLAAEERGLIPGLSEMSMPNCAVGLAWKEPRPEGAAANLACAIALRPQTPKLPPEALAHWPAELNFHLSGQALVPLNREAPLSGDLRLELDTASLRLSELTAQSVTTAQLGGTLASLPSSLHVLLATATELRVPDFAAMVETLKGTAYAVPAPFNVLTGQVALRLSGLGDVAQQTLTVPFVATTQLATPPGAVPQEIFDTHLNGELKLRKAETGTTTTLKLAYELDNAELVLPTLSISSKPPQLVPDKRMRPLQEEAAASTKTEPSALSYELTVSTPAQHPFRLISNLAKAPIPIALQLAASSATTPQGSASVGEVPLNLFRRQAFVDRFRVALRGPEQAPSIDGALSVVYPDYIVRVLVAGTTEAPRITMESEPPLPQRQLVSVLLFGRDMSELDEDQLKSTDSFMAALADSALSLGSLYLLAATPVQSIGYDPATNAFTARITLASGTSLNIGSDLGDYQKFGLERRLNRNWALETYVERNTVTDDQAVTALLEWRRRF